MSDRERNIATQNAEQVFQIRPKRYVFYDKGTGTERFEVRAGRDGRLPIDEAASLMAIHCVARGRAPKDFGVMIAPDEDVLQTLLPFAKRLVHVCAESRSPVRLSRRQQEVLRALMKDASNKEIAEELHVSVRTVKFHLSALFEKFEVRSRGTLIRRAADILLPQTPENAAVAPVKEMLRADGHHTPPRAHFQPLRLVAMQRASR